MRRQAVVVVDGGIEARDAAFIRRAPEGATAESLACLLHSLFACRMDVLTFDVACDVVVDAGFHIGVRQPSTRVLGMSHDVTVAFVTVSVHPRTLKRTVCIDTVMRYVEVSA